MIEDNNLFMPTPEEIRARRYQPTRGCHDYTGFMAQFSNYGCNSQEFADYLTKPFENLTIDLSNATLTQVIEAVIKYKQSLNPKAYKKYYSVLKYIRMVEEDFAITLYPQQVTDIFWNNFIKYLMDKGLAISSITTLCHQIRSALNWGAKHMAPVSTTYDYVILPKYCHQQVALSPDEISWIYHFDVHTLPRYSQYINNLERVRDTFVLACNLGQRFSDIIRIDEHCFKDGIFTILQKKTGNIARVDLGRMTVDKRTTMEILERYGYVAPIRYSKQKLDSSDEPTGKFNKYLKELLKYIGGPFNETIRRETKINSFVEVEDIPKWQLISSHTARRSFATINVLRGYPASEIRRATGHKSESSFEKYICYFTD